VAETLNAIHKRGWPNGIRYVRAVVKVYVELIAGLKMPKAGHYDFVSFNGVKAQHIANTVNSLIIHLIIVGNEARDCFTANERSEFSTNE